MREKAVFFLPVNILTVWSPASWPHDTLPCVLILTFTILLKANKKVTDFWNLVKPPRTTPEKLIGILSLFLVTVTNLFTHLSPDDLKKNDNWLTG